MDNNKSIKDIVSSFYSASRVYGVISVDVFFDMYYQEEETDVYYNIFVKLMDEESDLFFYQIEEEWYLSVFDTLDKTLLFLKENKDKELLNIPFDVLLKM